MFLQAVYLWLVSEWRGASPQSVAATRLSLRLEREAGAAGLQRKGQGQQELASGGLARSHAEKHPLNHEAPGGPNPAPATT